MLGLHPHPQPFAVVIGTRDGHRRRHTHLGDVEGLAAAVEGDRRHLTVGPLDRLGEVEPRLASEGYGPAAMPAVVAPVATGPSSDVAAVMGGQHAAVGVEQIDRQR